MPDDDSELARRALAIAYALGTATAGEKAEARRMDDQGAPVFWRQVARLGIGKGQEAEWLRYTRLVALLTPASATESIHQASRYLGAALAEKGVSERPKLSEQRLARMLAARGLARDDALERAIRMLARARPKLDVISLARFALNQDGNALARSYYQQLDHSQSEATAYV